MWGDPDGEDASDSGDGAFVTAAGSGSSDSEAADPHQKLIIDAALARAAADAAADAPPRRVRALKQKVDGPSPGGGDGIVVVYVDDSDGGGDGGDRAARGAQRSPRCRPRTRALTVDSLTYERIVTCAEKHAPKAAAAAAAAREGTPDDDATWGGESAEMRRLLRAPRYFDDDFEAVRARRCGVLGGFIRGRACCLLAP